MLVHLLLESMRKMAVNLSRIEKLPGYSLLNYLSNSNKYEYLKTKNFLEIQCFNYYFVNFIMREFINEIYDSKFDLII